MNRPLYLPTYQIHRNRAIFYHVPHQAVTRSERQIDAEKNLSRGKYNGYLSPKARRILSKRLENWLEAVYIIRKSPKARRKYQVPYVAFVTLTLPAAQRHSDNEIKRRILMPFLEDLKSRFAVVNYFWRAEDQQNGNLHFHLIIDRFIPWREVRNLWNHHVESLGYISDFERVHGHEDPNSTDIHKPEIIRNMTAYVIKYCCKTEGGRPIQGRLHGSSDRLRLCRPYTFHEHQESPGLIDSFLKFSTKEPLFADRFAIYRCHAFSALKIYSPLLYEKLKVHYDEMLCYLYGVDVPREVVDVDNPEVVEGDIVVRKSPGVQLSFDDKLVWFCN